MGGAQAAPLGSYPWAVRLEARLIDERGQVSRSVKPFCSGSLISARYVLTAAHCIYQDIGRGERWTERLKPRVRFANQQGQPTVAVSRAAYYGPFLIKAGIEQPDLALLELEKDAPANPAPLGTPPPQYSEAIELGYGKHQAKSNALSSYLQVGELYLGDSQSCQGQVKPFEICGIGDPDRGRAAGGCAGDSGGPLVSPENKIIGVVSIGGGEGDYCTSKPKQRLTIFTRPDSAKTWLQQQTGAELFGEPAKQLNQDGPVGPRLSLSQTSRQTIKISANAQGKDWTAEVIITGQLKTKAGREEVAFYAKLTPAANQQNIRVASRLNQQKAGWLKTDGRFYNQLNNGSTAPRQTLKLGYSSSKAMRSDRRSP